jgi:hypothetical protein
VLTVAIDILEHHSMLLDGVRRVNAHHNSNLPCLEATLAMTSSSASSTVAARISAFQNRPLSSFDSDRTPRTTYPRKQRSLGSLVVQLDGANELLEARARLKHIGEVQRGPKKEERNKQHQEPPVAIRRRRAKSSVLEELDDLLDTAIGEHAKQFTTTDSRDTTDDAATDWPLPRTEFVTSKSPSEYALRYSGAAAKRRQSRQRQLQADSSDTFESNTAAHAHGPSIDSERPRSSEDTDIAHYHLPLSEAEREPPRVELPIKMQLKKSPIKQRAALFEKLAQHEAVRVHDMPHIHDARNSAKITKIWPPQQDATAKEKVRGEFIPSLEKHHFKFHHGRDEAFEEKNADSPPGGSSPEKPRTTHVPPIPLALPQLVSSRRRSRPDVAGAGDVFTTAPQTTRSSVSVPVVPMPKSEEPKVTRDTSFSWPLRWDLLRKAPNIPTKESSIVARAEPDDHVSAKTSHDNQHRVHDLLMAAQESTKEPIPEQDVHHLIHRQSSPKHASMPGTLADTPRGSSSAEKEVTSQSTMTSAGAITPSTPRGRHRLQDFEISTYSPAGDKEVPRRVEQRFALSRSRSRAGGVRVQVEIRSPNTSPERGGEHTVIVTANVTSFDEEDDEVKDAE